MTVEERSDKAAQLFLQGYNCCQSVVLAFADILPIDENTIKSLASGFGGGMGRLREVCGAFSGMVFLAGILKPADDPNNIEARTANYALVQQFASEYRAEFDSIICRDILGIKKAVSDVSETAVPSPRNANYYKSRPCAYACAVAAGIVAKYITEAGFEDKTAQGLTQA